MRSVHSQVVILVFLSAAGRAPAQCAPEWANPFATPLGKPIPNTGVNFDPDGDGPLPTLAVFAGRFVTAEGVSHDGVAGWDGTEWIPIGPAFTLATGESFMCSAVIDPDGSGPLPATLWMGGNFSNFAGVATRGIARFQGGAWAASGADPVTIVSRMIALDEDGPGPQVPRLCVQAGFPGFGDRIAILAGDHWEILGGGPMSGSITELIAADLDGAGPLPTRPVVVGDFSSFSGLDVHHVAVWTGATWESVAGGTDGNIGAATMHDPDGAGPCAAELYIVGHYAHAGMVEANGIARLRDGAWQSVSNPLASPGIGIPYMTCVRSADEDGNGPRRPALFVAGTGPGSSPSYRVFRGDGETPWEDIGIGLEKWWLPPVSGRVVDMNFGGRTSQRVFTGDLMWDGRTWTRPTPRPYQFADMKSIDLDGVGPLSSTLVVVGEEMALTNPYTSDCIAQWDGSRWLAAGTGNISGTINAIDLYDSDGAGSSPPRLIAAGRMKIDGVTCGVAIQGETGWEVFGNSLLSPTNSVSVSKMAIIDFDGPGGNPPGVVVSGSSSIFANPALNGLAMWNGSSWSGLGTFAGLHIRDMQVLDPDGQGPARPSLYAAVSYMPFPSNGIVRWDGATWSALVDVQTGQITDSAQYSCLTSFEREDGIVALCAGAGGTVYARQWENGHWSTMGQSQSSQSISSMIVHDDGISSGMRPSLYLTGLVTGLSDDPSSKYVGRWDGAQWRTLGSGLNSPGKLLASVDFDGSGTQAAELFVYGSFSRAGAIRVDKLASWRVAFPRFVASPWSRTVVEGSRVSLKLAVSGQAPFTFQWRKDGLDVVDGGGVSGATTRELVIASAQAGDAGSYDCVVSNVCGSKTCPLAVVRVCAALPGPDVNHDGAINGRDISPFVDEWLEGASGVCVTDLNANGSADGQDLQWFIQWLLSP